MRRLFAATAMLTLTACSPAQTLRWFAWHDDHPRTAERWATTECDELCSDQPGGDWDHDGLVEPEPTTSAPAEAASVPVGESSAVAATSSSSDGYPCSEWHSTALAAGWSDDEWPTLSAIMYRESRCQPDVTSSTGCCHGLVQMSEIHLPIGPCSTAECYFDPYGNLASAHELYEEAGWAPWACC